MTSPKRSAAGTAGTGTPAGPAVLPDRQYPQGYPQGVAKPKKKFGDPSGPPGFRVPPSKDSGAARCRRPVTVTSAASHGVTRASEYCVRQRCRRIGFPAPAVASGISASPSRSRVAAVPRSMTHGFILSYASFPSRVLRAVPARDLPATSTFLGVPSPFATSTDGVHSLRLAPSRRGHPKPAPFRPRRFSRPRRFPPPPIFVGLFHPTATSGVRSSGAFPPAEPHGFPPAVALLSFAKDPCSVARAPEPSARLQGFSLRVSPLRDAVV
jgi:hypothetical protein